MWKFKVLLLVGLLVSSSGCAVVALHPLVVPGDKDSVFEPTLVGTWEETEPAGFPGDKPGNRYTVSRAATGYTVTAEADQTQLTMQVLKTGGRYLLDIYCPSDGPALPVHFLFKLRLEQDRAWLAVMDSGWFRKQIEVDPQLRHEVLTEDGDRIVLTGSTAELRRSLLPYFADDRSFDDEEELKRVK